MSLLLALMLLQNPAPLGPPITLDELIDELEAERSEAGPIPIPEGATRAAIQTTLVELAGIRERAAIQEGAIAFSLNLLAGIAAELAGVSLDDYTVDWNTLTLVPKPEN